MVSTSDCGSENPGSIPGSGNFFNKKLKDEIQQNEIIKKKKIKSIILRIL